VPSTPPTQTYTLRLCADYFQFYLQDDELTVGDMSDAWTHEATARMLAVVPRAVGIGTGRNFDVDVTLVVATVEPSFDPLEWDNVVEADLEIQTGRMVIAGCTDLFPDAFRVELQRGNYRVRASARNLASIQPNGIDGQDSYEVSIWPSEPLGIRIVKRYKGVS
jgi:hypothetical protein